MSNTNEESVTRADATKQTQSEQRSQRIADYHAAALRNRCPLIANVGAANSDLMRVRCFVQESLDNAMAELMPSLSGVALVTPSIDMALRIDKQIDRFTQLAIQLTRANRRAADLGQVRPETTDEILAED